MPLQVPHASQLIVKVAFRNVRRNWRHSIAALATLAVGFLALALFQGYIEAFDWGVNKPFLKVISDASVKLYLDCVAKGMCPEQARMFLPQNVYSEWIWTGSLYAWVRVWKQRTYPTAQLETRNLVHQIEPIMQQHFPVSWEALTKG